MFVFLGPLSFIRKIVIIIATKDNEEQGGEKASKALMLSSS